MIHFNALDFNACRSEEVISFFWCSVSIKALLHNILTFKLENRKKNFRKLKNSSKHNFTINFSIWKEILGC